MVERLRRHFLDCLVCVTAMVALACGGATSWRDLVNARGRRPDKWHDVAMDNGGNCSALSIMVLVVWELGEPSGRWRWW
jgi:hypothetical protein